MQYLALRDHAASSAKEDLKGLLEHRQEGQAALGGPNGTAQRPNSPHKKATVRRVCCMRIWVTGDRLWCV